MFEISFRDENRLQVRLNDDLYKDLNVHDLNYFIDFFFVILPFLFLCIISSFIINIINIIFSSCNIYILILSFLLSIISIYYIISFLSCSLKFVQSCANVNVLYAIELYK